MTLNCKPGDVALIVHSAVGNEGCVVTVGDYVGTVGFSDGAFRPNCWKVHGRLRATTWTEVHRETFGCDGIFPDDWLKPLRDSDGEDEMLRIAGKPKAQPRALLLLQPKERQRA